jgi:hypothetical protein
MPYLLWSEWRSGWLRFLDCQLFPRHVVDHQLASVADASARKAPDLFRGLTDLGQVDGKYRR